MEAMTHRAHTTQNSNDCFLAWELSAVSFILQLEIQHPTGQWHICYYHYMDKVFRKPQNDVIDQAKKQLFKENELAQSFKPIVQSNTMK